MLATVEIRIAEPGHLAGYIELYSSVASEGMWIGGEAPVERDLLADRANEALTDPDMAQYVAVDAETVVGAIDLRLQRGVVGLGMMIASDRRGQGTGQRLLDAGIMWAQSVEAHKMALEVWPHNGRAIALYERSGFEVEGRVRRHHRRRSGELWDAIVMGLVLDTNAPGSPHLDAPTVSDGPSWRQ